jgi:hypothetical protein
MGSFVGFDDTVCECAMSSIAAGPMVARLYVQLTYPDCFSLGATRPLAFSLQR